MNVGGHPWLQRHWDWRAATNFVCGGAGAGLVLAAALEGRGWKALAGALLVGIGLAAVWLEIGRPWRALNVFLHPRRSWMSREAIVAPLLLGSALAATALPGTGGAAAGLAAAALAIAFVYCQGRILQAARGIPAWREPLTVPLVVATGLAEGAGLALVMSLDALPATTAWMAAMLLARWALVLAWRGRIRPAPPALRAIDAALTPFHAATLAALLLGGAALLAEGRGAVVLQALAGMLAAAGGIGFKAALVTRGAFNQGWTIPHLPVRGQPRRS